MRNAEYWKKGRPYLDGIEWRVIDNRSTRILAFVAGDFDMTFPTDVTIPLLKDVTSQAPTAVCEVVPRYVMTNLIVNRELPPFNDPKIRYAMALSLDRKAFIDILSAGKADIGGVMLPLPEGAWGMPPDVLADTARLFRRRGEKPCGGPKDHGGARLRQDQASQGEGIYPQHPHLP